MKPYVDGYVLPIPKTKLVSYKKMATQAGKVWMKHGALACFECVGEDLKPNMGGEKIATFPEMVKTKPSETVIFAFVVYKSKAHRNQVNKKVMKDPSMNDPNFDPKDMPFEVKRMVYGGFESIVHYQ